MKLLFSFFLFLTFSAPVLSHHYKGLPHNDYFANYPQVPTMEFLFEDDAREIFLTVYNFQGISLESVQDNKMVRLYIFLYDVKRDTAYEKPTKFEIYSRGKLIHTEIDLLPEEESIYSIHKNIINQDDLELRVFFQDGDKIVPVKLPFKITKTFFQKYGIILIIFIFFFIIGLVKKYLIKESSGEQAHAT